MTGRSHHRAARAIALSVVVAAATSARAATGAYVSNGLNGTISTVPAGGGPAATFASGLDRPFGIALGPAGALYVGEQFDGRIDRVSPTGVVSPFVTIGGGATLSGLATDPAGNVYAADQYNGVVYHVTPAGAVSTYATGVGTPEGIAFDSRGDLFVADYTGNAVDRVAPGGGAGAAFVTGLSSAVGVTTDAAGDVYASSVAGGYVERYSPAGADMGRWAAVGSASALAFDAAGDLLVTSEGGGAHGTSVYAVAPGGGTVVPFATGLSGPFGIAVVPAAVPEPASAGLLAVAAAGLLGRRGGRRH